MNLMEAGERDGPTEQVDTGGTRPQSQDRLRLPVRPGLVEKTVTGRPGPPTQLAGPWTITACRSACEDQPCGGWRSPVAVPEWRGSAIGSRALMDAQLKIEESIDHQSVLVALNR
jgi:hypothetical protein